MRVTVNDPKRTRRTTYIVLGVVFLLLVGVALFAFSSARSTAQAEGECGVPAAGAGGPHRLAERPW